MSALFLRKFREVRLGAIVLLWPLAGCATMSLEQAIEPNQTFEQGSLAAVERVEWAYKSSEGGLQVCVTGLSVGEGDSLADSAKFTLRVEAGDFAEAAGDSREPNSLQRLDVGPENISYGCKESRTGQRVASERITIADMASKESGLWRGWDNAIANHHSEAGLTETLYDVRTVSAGGLIYFAAEAAPDRPGGLYRITPARTKAEPNPGLKVLYPAAILVDIVTSPVQYLTAVFLVAIGEQPPE